MEGRRSGRQSDHVAFDQSLSDMAHRVLPVLSAGVWLMLIVTSLRSGKAQRGPVARASDRKSDAFSFYSALTIYVLLLLFSLYEAIAPTTGLNV